MVIFPLMMSRPYQAVYHGSIYSEDSIEYNALYQQVFDSNGNASTDDFFLFVYYSVDMGAAVVVTLDLVEGSVEIYAIAIFLIGVETTIVEETTYPELNYIHSFSLESYGVYGVVVFGHRLSSSVGVEIGFSVLVQT